VVETDDLDEFSVTPGDGLTAYGYPEHGGSWPYAPARVRRGHLLRLNTAGPMFEAALETRVGFSGGPVFMDDGTCLGMLIGETDGVTRIIPLHVLLTL
jgi:hypothetical protein